MREINHTQCFEIKNEKEISVKQVIDTVYMALTEKGYNPVSQIVGYIMSG